MTGRQRESGTSRGNGFHVQGGEWFIAYLPNGQCPSNQHWTLVAETLGTYMYGKEEKRVNYVHACGLRWCLSGPHSVTGREMAESSLTGGKRHHSVVQQNGAKGNILLSMGEQKSSLKYFPTREFATSLVSRNVQIFSRWYSCLQKYHLRRACHIFLNHLQSMWSKSTRKMQLQASSFQLRKKREKCAKYSLKNIQEI